MHSRGRIGIGPIIEAWSALQPERTSPKDNSMIRKFALALIATTMLMAPALAADAVKSTPAAPVAAATTTAAPAVTPASKDASKTEHRKTIKIAHRHAHHLMVAKTHGPASHLKIAKVTKPAIKTATETPAVSTATPAASKPAVNVIKADHVVKKIKVANHHGHHLTVAKNHKPARPVKAVNASNPVTHANVVKTQGQVAHEAKSGKVIAN
jgi:hypothetical protein